MKAIILEGGYGTRLRPLILTQSKLLIESANKPMMYHQMEAVVAAGMDTVILAVSYRAKLLEKQVRKQGNHLSVTVHFGGGRTEGDSWCAAISETLA